MYPPSIIEQYRIFHHDASRLRTPADRYCQFSGCPLDVCEVALSPVDLRRTQQNRNNEPEYHRINLRRRVPTQEPERRRRQLRSPGDSPLGPTSPRSNRGQDPTDTVPDLPLRRPDLIIRQPQRTLPVEHGLVLSVCKLPHDDAYRPWDGRHGVVAHGVVVIQPSFFRLQDDELCSACPPGNKSSPHPPQP